MSFDDVATFQIKGLTISYCKNLDHAHFPKHCVRQGDVANLKHIKTNSIESGQGRKYSSSSSSFIPTSLSEPLKNRPPQKKYHQGSSVNSWQIKEQLLYELWTPATSLPPTISCQKTHCVTYAERGKIKMQSGFLLVFLTKCWC